MDLPSIGEAEWLRSSATQQVFAALNQRGHTARCVGGCVRNSLFAHLEEGAGRPAPVTDIDFATTATPEEVLEIAAAAGLRTVPTGLQHGTVLSEPLAGTAQARRHCRHSDRAGLWNVSPQNV